MLTWSDARHDEDGEAGTRLAHAVTCWWVLLTIAAVLASHLATRAVVYRGSAAARELERATGADFGGRAPASPDVAILEIGPPMARRIAGDTLDLTFAIPGDRDPTRLLYVAIRWVHEAPVAITAW